MLAFSRSKSDYYAMLRANIALFDDEMESYKEVEQALEGSNHHLAVWETTRQASLHVLEQVYAGQLVIDACLLDGKMDSGGFEDAMAIEQHARKRFGRSLPIIGFSMSEMAGRILPIPRQLDIGKFGLARLVTLLDEMPETQLQRLAE